MRRRPQRATQSRSSAASDVYKREYLDWGRVIAAVPQDNPGHWLGSLRRERGDLGKGAHVLAEPVLCCPWLPVDEYDGRGGEREAVVLLPLEQRLEPQPDRIAFGSGPFLRGRVTVPDRACLRVTVHAGGYLDLLEGPDSRYLGRAADMTFTRSEPQVLRNAFADQGSLRPDEGLSLIHISEPTRLGM